MTSGYEILFCVILCITGSSWLTHQEQVDNVPKFLRTVFEFNEKIWTNLLNPEKTDHPPTLTVPIGKIGRVNGKIGLNSDDDLKSWAITVATSMTQNPPKEFSIPLEEIKKMGQIDLVTQLKCIEGWSDIRSYGGVRFIDFLNHYHLGTHSGKNIDFKNHPEDLFSYVGLETPDGEYYVSIDMMSMLAPDTLLAFEMNGAPLAVANGAPLRLAISNKYGVKNLKRIGKIQFADSKLPDYWGEQGYDWFIGL